MLQVKIAQEETKFGLDKNEIVAILNSEDYKALKNIQIEGVMGMATFTDNIEQVRNEFKVLKTIFEYVKEVFPELQLKTISMGMRGDYQIAIEEGSTMVRVGSSIFGVRNFK